MSRPRRQAFALGASTLAMGAPEPALVPAAATVVAPADSGMGDSASQAALARLDQAVNELRAFTVAPFLRRAVDAIGEEQHQLAAEMALKALGVDERSGLAWYLLAIAREQAGDFKHSIACYETALQLTENPAEIANDLGRLAYRLGMKEIAAQLFTHYLAANPDCAQGANNLACALRDLNQYEAAIDILKPAITAHPDSSPLWNTLGTILGEQGLPGQALVFYDEALRFEPQFYRARYNRANARLDVGDAAGALEDCEKAMVDTATASDACMMRLARSTMRLCLGQVGEGWDDYEIRLDPDFSGLVHIQVDRPRWTPDSDIRGKHLLLMGEQGLGDEVLFANLLPDILKDLGPRGKLTLALEPRLVPLFERSFPGIAVGGHATYKIDAHTLRTAPFIKDPAAIDLWTPMASPLRRYRRSVEAFADQGAYLTPDPDRVDYWRGQFAHLPGPKVGVLWKSLKLTGSRLKYFSPFEQWRPVLETPGVSFINLQYGDCQAELDQAREALGLTIHQPQGIDLKDHLDDVAALSCALDLIVGPPNATTNIAAACGAPVWLISTPAAWPRLGTDHYPWYPQVRAFIPDGFNAWEPVMRRIAGALGELA